MKPGPQRHFGNNLRSLLGWRRADRDVREEMALHVDLRAQELQGRGLAADEARARAEREVGPPTAVVPLVDTLARETDRRSAIRQWLDEAAQDMRHGVRVFARTPAFSIVAVLTIAVGIGANTAMFATISTLFLRPLPFDPEGRLVRVREFRTNADGTRNQVDASRRTADAIAARPDLFDATATMTGTSRTLVQESGAIHLQATGIAAGFSNVLGLTPVVGRVFTSEEERAGTDASVVMISHGVWRTIFGGTTDVVGRAIRLDTRSYEIIGVLPPGFEVPYGSDVWFPTRFADNQRSVFILARLSAGVTLEQANAELEPLGRRLSAAYPDVMNSLGVIAIPARDHFVGARDRVPLALMGAVGFLLLIGCANVALLLTARFAARQREVAVRSALGCGRGRQIRQFVTEALLLFAAGGAVGLVLAIWAKDSLMVFLPEALATQVGLTGIPLDWSVVLFATALAAGTGLFFGLISAIRSTRADLQSVIKDAGRGTTGDRSRGTLRALAVIEMALALVLLTAAAMMADTFYRLQREDLGFEPDGLLTAQAEMDAERYASGPARRAFIDRLLERLAALPGVEGAAVTTVNPLCCGDWGIRVTPEGLPPAPDGRLPVIAHQLVSAGFFEAMEIRILEGRGFTASDVEGREPVVVIDHRLARRYWPGQSAIGKRIKRGAIDGPHPWLTIVGVVATVHDASEYAESWYLPYAQHATGPSSNGLNVMVRTSGDAGALAPMVRAIATEIDSALALHDFKPMIDVRSEQLQQNRLGAVVSVALAVAGLLLASLGLYGVLAFVMASETREIGVRLALGARPSNLLRLVFGRGLRLCLVGLAIGAAGAFGAARALQQIVPEAQPQPAIIAAAALVLLLSALLAMLPPARRALRIDAIDALRSE
jgi:putative ABC transport system permease protein